MSNDPQTFSEWTQECVAFQEAINAQTVQIITPYGVTTMTFGDLTGVFDDIQSAVFYLEELEREPTDGVAATVKCLTEDMDLLAEVVARPKFPKPMPRPPEL
jgi:hypothetical protein